MDRLREFTRPTGEEELMNVDYPTPRLRVGIKEAAALAVLLLLALFSWLGIRGMNPEPHTPTPAAIGSQLESPAADDALASSLSEDLGEQGMPTTGPADMTGSPAPQQEADVVVSVVGEVLHPGLVTLAPGARVADALAIAVPREEAQLQSLNLAQKLNDGEQVHVSTHLPEAPGPGIAGASSPPGASSNGAVSGVIGTGHDNDLPDKEAAGKVSLNTADAAELMTLSGVGEKTAAAILAHRETIGGFHTIEQLQEVKGIGPAKFEAIREQITL